MKSLNRFTLASVVILLLAISLASFVAAHGSDESRNDTNQQNQPMMDGNHIRDVSDHMAIEATINVDQFIILNLNVAPTEEMEGMMDDHMGSGGHMNGQSMMDDYKNEIRVEFYSLVEFVDQSENGYSTDDTEISNFPLSNQTLNQPEIVDNRYIITSYDNQTFGMDVDLKFEDGLFHGFKWSLEINYQFQSNTSELAMLHRISTSAGSMMEQHQMQHGNMNRGSHMQYSENHMMDTNEHLPMSFNWATTVEVDGQIENITATSENNLFALAVPQGDSIIYDPEISADVSDIRSLDIQLSELQESVHGFAFSVNSPTIFGLLLGFSVLVILVAIAIYIRRK